MKRFFGMIAVLAGLFVALVLLAMAIGSWVSKGLAAFGLTLPAYIGAMLAAAVRIFVHAARA